MGRAFNEQPSGRVDGGKPDFSEAYLVSARYGECRRVGGKVLSIFQIACGINEAVVSCKLDEGITFADLKLADVIDMVPKGRRFIPSDRWEPSLSDQEAYLTVQPILLIKLETVTIVLDGLKRLELLQEKGSELVRCVLLSEKRAFHFGRKGISVFDDKGLLVELDIKQRTLKGSLPPSIDAREPYSGTDYFEEYDEDVRPALSGHRRAAVPRVSEIGKVGRKGKIIERDKLLIEETHLASLAPHISCVRNRRLQIIMEIAAKDARKITLDPKGKINLVLDRDISADRNIFKHGNATKSAHEIILIRFLMTLFKTIETLHRELIETGLIEIEKSSSRKGIYNPRVGHTIVNRDQRYRHAMGSFADLQETIKDWSEIAELTSGAYAHGLNDGLFQLGLERCHGSGDHSAEIRIDHAYRLLQATLKTLRRAHVQTGHLRDLRQQNNGKAAKSDLRETLDRAVNSEPSEEDPKPWVVDRLFRALLALHARVNPAKLWLDDMHLTLMYQWFIALGDLHRCGSMIVTCHMAQEFFLVHGFRSSGDNPDFNRDWSYFDEALSLAVKKHPARENVVAELVHLCATAMVKGLATRVRLKADGGKCFEPATLSKEISVLAEAAIWLT